MPDVVIRDRSDNDFFILVGCDGIWETKKTEEICEIIKEDINQKKKNDQIVEKLLD